VAASSGIGGAYVRDSYEKILKMRWLMNRNSHTREASFVTRKNLPGIDGSR